MTFFTPAVEEISTFRASMHKLQLEVDNQVASDSFKDDPMEQSTEFVTLKARAVEGVIKLLNVSRAKSEYIVTGVSLGILLAIPLAIFVYWKWRQEKVKRDVIKLNRGRVVAFAGRHARLLTAPLMIFR
jgi:glutamate/tyrosine decarboxylase-like PLP-dependent enzyme